MCINWISEPVDYAVDGDGLEFTLKSGGQSHTFRMSRHNARRAIHAATRVLDEADRAQRRVVPFGHL